MNIELTQDEIVSLRLALKSRIEQCDQQTDSAFFRGEKAVIQGILAKIDSDIDDADDDYEPLFAHDEADEYEGECEQNDREECEWMHKIARDAATT